MVKYTFELKLKIVHDYLDGKGDWTVKIQIKRLEAGNALKIQEKHRIMAVYG